LRAFTIVLLFTALLSGSAVARGAASPCELASPAELRAVLGGKAVQPDPSSIGEETAPSCTWTTRGSGARLKVEIWSGDELAVVDAKTARGYFTAKQRDALEHHGVRLRVLGGPAFRTRFDRAGGEIGVLRKRRFVIFSFERVPLDRALTFVKAVGRRL